MTKLYFTQLPNLSLLIAFSLRRKQREDLGHLDRQCLRFRELIFRDPDILVAVPEHENESLWAIARKEKLKDSQFLNLLEQMCFQIIEQVDVNPDLFQYCLTFTLIQRIAPCWNRVGRVLLAGKQFLTMKTKQDAVRLEVVVTDKLCLSIECLMISMPPNHLSELGSSFKGNKDSITEGQAVKTTFEHTNCYVLPRFTVANIVSISKEIPLESPFEDFEALRHHWKVMYGFRIPQDPPPYYVNVSFGSGTTFTYPPYCVRFDLPIEISRCDEEKIAYSFLQSFMQRMPSVCGEPTDNIKKITPLSNKLSLPFKNRENNDVSTDVGDSANTKIGAMAAGKYSSGGTNFENKKAFASDAVHTQTSSNHQMEVSKRYIPRFTQKTMRRIKGDCSNKQASAIMDACQNFAAKGIPSDYIGGIKLTDTVTAGVKAKLPPSRPSKIQTSHDKSCLIKDKAELASCKSSIVSLDKKTSMFSKGKYKAPNSKKQLKTKLTKGRYSLQLNPETNMEVSSVSGNKGKADTKCGLINDNEDRVDFPLSGNKSSEVDNSQNTRQTISKKSMFSKISDLTPTREQRTLKRHSQVKSNLRLSKKDKEKLILGIEYAKQLSVSKHSGEFKA